MYFTAIFGTAATIFTSKLLYTTLQSFATFSNFFLSNIAADSVAIVQQHKDLKIQLLQTTYNQYKDL